MTVKEYFNLEVTGILNTKVRNHKLLHLFLYIVDFQRSSYKHPGNKKHRVSSFVVSTRSCLFTYLFINTLPYNESLFFLLDTMYVLESIKVFIK